MGYLNNQLTKMASAVMLQKMANEGQLSENERIGHGLLGAVNAAGGGISASLIPGQLHDSKKLLSEVMEEADPAASKFSRALQGFKKLDGHGKLGVLAPALTGALTLAGTGLGIHHLNKAFSKENAQ